VTARNKCRASVNGDGGEDAEEGEHGEGGDLRPTPTDVAVFRHTRSGTSQSESLSPSTRTMLSDAAARVDAPPCASRARVAKRRRIVRTYFKNVTLYTAVPLLLLCLSALEMVQPRAA
jgi:hypothetical protein